MSFQFTADSLHTCSLFGVLQLWGGCSSLARGVGTSRPRYGGALQPGACEGTWTGHNPVVKTLLTVGLLLLSDDDVGVVKVWWWSDEEAGGEGVGWGC
jgi:hypothetical protein